MRIFYWLLILGLLSCGTLPRVTEKDTPVTHGCLDILLTSSRPDGNSWNITLNKWIAAWNKRQAEKQAEKELKEHQESTGMYVTWVNDSISSMFQPVGVTEAKPYASPIKFKLVLNKPDKEIYVGLYLFIDAPDDKLIQWENQIIDKWSRRIYVIDYSVTPQEEYLLYVIPVIFPAKEWGMRSNEEYGDIDRRYYIHTTKTAYSDVTTWSLAGASVAGHEVGHMLGNNDEYGINDSVSYIKTQVASNSIMSMGIAGKDEKIPHRHHYDYILKQLKILTKNDKLKTQINPFKNTNQSF